MKQLLFTMHMTSFNPCSGPNEVLFGESEV